MGEITVNDAFRIAFANVLQYTTFSSKEIVDKVLKVYARAAGSILPRDHCYNSWNEGLKNLEWLPLFEYLYDEKGDKRFKYLGENYIYEKEVYHKPKNGLRVVVGKWKNGEFLKYDKPIEVGEKGMLNKYILNKYVAEYKENFMEIRYGKEHNEIYKWEAVEHFNQIWNIDSSDFFQMLEDSLGKTENLLQAGMFYPRKMLLGYAQREPETIREMFKVLYDETKDLSERVRNFTSAANALNNKYPEDGQSHYQNTRAISVYLWLKYPDKYYIYQKEFYSIVAKALEANYVFKSDGKPETMIEGFKFFDEIREELRKDAELLKLNLQYGVEGFKDESLNTLTEDVAFFIKSQETAKVWKPSLKEYDPKISEKKWQELWDDKDVFDENSKKLMKEMMLLKGEATCSQLAEYFLGDSNKFRSYNNAFMHLGKKVYDKINCPLYEKDDEKDKNYWAVSCFYRRVDKSVDDGVKGLFVFKLREELRQALINVGLQFGGIEKVVVNKGQNIMSKYPKNLILYGPPGTGKTYNTVNYSVAIIEGKKIDDVTKEDRKAVLDRYNQYKNTGLIEFCTFHQSFGYEEFIEGIKPDKTEDGKVTYSIKQGLFKRFCDKAGISSVSNDGDYQIRENPTVWKVALLGSGDNYVRKDCMENSHIRIGYGDDKEVDDILETEPNTLNVSLKRFAVEMQIGDIVVTSYTSKEFDAIGVITGEFEKNKKYKDFQQVRTVKWLVQGIKENILPINDGKVMNPPAVTRLPNIDLEKLLSFAPKNNPKDHKRIFIIDEINRGNISKIFGELITLIEDSKRIGAEEEMRVRLPYSGDKFGVPNSVYLIGTMNTADRSIALLDTALRRRFKFIEMQPNTDLLKDINVEGVEVKAMLDMINRRIEVLYDREHTIGHSFFMSLNNESSIEDLAEIFEHNVIPLLKEYFYDDYEKIAAVLSDNLDEPNELNFIKKENDDYAKIFNSDIALLTAYTFNKGALKNPEAYKKIYK